MEPPAKRLRLLQSVDVDETAPEYIRKKEEAKAVLKNRFENIFAKYENIPQHIPDVLHMQTGELLVDNGHIKRAGKDKAVLEGFEMLGEVISSDTIHNGLEAYDVDSEDELAPSLASKFLGLEGDNWNKPDEPRAKEHVQPAVPSTNEAQAGPSVVLDRTHILNALNTHLNTGQPQSPQLPQTPLGLQNQNALLMGLSQVVNQAISQAVSQVLPQAIANHLGHAPTNALNAISTHASTAAPAADQISTPGSDSKWYFPSLPEGATPRVVEQPSLTSSQNPASVQQIAIDDSDTLIEQERDELPIDAFEDVTDYTPLPSKIKRRNRKPKYQFTEEENLYIIKQRTVHGWTMEKIKNSRPQWIEWPLHVLQKQWRNKLKHISMDQRDDANVEEYGSDHTIEHDAAQGTFPPISKDIDDAPRTPLSKKGCPDRLQLSDRQEQDEHHQQNDDRFPPSSPGLQLLTPSSLEHSEGCNVQKDGLNGVPGIVNIVEAVADLDEQDSDLLSLANDDKPEEVPAIEDVISEPAVLPQESILLSIERNGMQEGDEKLENLQQSQRHSSSRVEVARQNMYKPPPTSTKEATSSIVTTPRSSRKRRKAREISFAVESESEDELDLVPTGDISKQSRSSPVRSRTNGPQDELEGQITSGAKHGQFTPRAFACTAPHLATPKSAPQFRTSNSSTSKKNPKLTNREIKNLWAKPAQAGTPRALRPTKSFRILNKRSRDENSEDELAD